MGMNQATELLTSTNTSLSEAVGDSKSYQVCPKCSARKHLTDFAIVRNGVAMLCFDCQRQISVLDYQEQLERLVTRTGLADLSKMSRQKIESPHISEACEALVKKFGGLEGFANFYYAQITTAATDNPGGRQVLEACKTVLNLISASTEHRKSAPDVVNLSNDDLEREKASLILKLVVRGGGEAMDILKQIALGGEHDVSGIREGIIEAQDDRGGAATPPTESAAPVRADTTAEGSD
jgi:hypothetical protein